MADFNYFLNRQGIRGLQGVKGDQGDSPIITVQTETPNEYILKITNPDGTELISPNLRGNKININEGTYVRYNTDTGELYTSTADGATGELAGVVRLATDADITDMDENSAVTPSQLADALSQYLVSPDGSVKIVQNAENSLTELTVEGGSSGELPIASADTLGGVKIGENLSITEDGVLSSTASGGDVSAAGDNTFTGTNDFNGAVNLNGITTAENLTVARNLTSSGEINAVSIKSTGIHSDDIKTTTNKKYLTEEDVDNQTIQIVEGKLHANLDGLGNEVNSLSDDVTSLNGRVTVAEADMLKKQNKLVQGDNITLTNNEDGTTTIAAESTVPTNMVTTDTEQTITGKKTLPLSTNIGGITFGIVSNTWGGRYLNIPHNWGISKLSMNENSLKFSDHQDKTIIDTYTTSSQGTVWGQTANSVTTFNTSTLGAGNGLQLYADNTGKAALRCPNGGYTFLRSKDIDNNTIKMVNGVLTASVSADLPIATATTLGGIKVGNNLSITEDGTLSANGGSAGTTDYTQLENKPQINSVELTGNKTLDDLGIQAKGDYQPAGDYATTADIPTKTSQLTNDSGFLTEAPTNMVTTDTDQTISGSKAFSARTNFNNGCNFNSSSYSANYFKKGLKIGNVDIYNTTGNIIRMGGSSTKFLTFNDDNIKFMSSSSTPGMNITDGTITTAYDKPYLKIKEYNDNTDTHNLEISYDTTNNNSWNIACGDQTFINTANIDTTYMKWDGTNKKLKVDTAAVAGLAMPSNKYVNLTLGENNSKYIAPADGYFAITAQLTKNNGSVAMFANNIYNYAFNSFSGAWLGTFIPIKKGATMVIQYQDIKATVFAFVYAEGSK